MRGAIHDARSWALAINQPITTLMYMYTHTHTPTPPHPHTTPPTHVSRAFSAPKLAKACRSARSLAGVSVCCRPPAEARVAV